ncbi:MAG: hypothetical protein V1702_05135 [Candidatus Woesearchaeota archaeon]
MDEGMHHSHQCIACKLLVLGIVLILVRLYTSWDMWVVIGTLAVIKGILLFMMPVCPCGTKAKGRK